MFLRPLLAAAALTLVAGAAVSAAPPAVSVTANVATPGAFVGYGFDQCLAPTQQAMNVWLRQSPYLAVGIYISGASRACKVQPHLTPTWVTTQLRKGWKLLPITLGPQAPCNPRFPRYGSDAVISPVPGSTGTYSQARKQGRPRPTARSPRRRRWASRRAAPCGTTSRASTSPRPAAADASLAFLSAWTREIHAQHYVSGVYSSAGSGIKMLDDVRVSDPTAYHLPDQIWIARWDGAANTSTSYIRNDGWRPGAPDEAVPRRPRRDLGRGHDQRRPRLPLARHTQRTCGEPLRRRGRRLRRLPPHRRDVRPGPDQGDAVPAHRAEGVRRADHRDADRRHGHRDERLAEGARTARALVLEPPRRG